MKKRILSILVICCMVLGLLPTTAFADNDSVKKAIQLGTSGISGYDSTNSSYDYIHFGTWNNSTVKWRVLDTKTNMPNAREEDGFFLLSDALLGTGEYGGVEFDYTTPYFNDWKGSRAQDWCNDFYSRSLSITEQKAVLATSKSDALYGMYYAASDNILDGDKVFFLSAEEAENAAYGFTDDNARIANYGDSAYVWWLRSPRKMNPDSAGTVNEKGAVIGEWVGQTNAARPAFNLKPDSVLLVSAAVGGKGTADGMFKIPEYSGDEWKLTLLDDTRTFRVTETTAAGKPGGTVTLNFSGPRTGQNEYISAIIEGKNGATHYGRIMKPTAADRQLSFTLPHDLASGNYKLHVFSEQYNGDYQTDYASRFQTVALTVEEAATEQFALTPGGTYYFDLSGENIPGTINDDLPDKSMHYVPFTYAGAVNAYKLTSAMATTEEYAQQYKYDHSLFIADHAVTHTVSWDDLNTKSLIFGKDYVAGGVGYTLRAPSVGSSYTGSGDSERGTPKSNEWDTMLNKDSGYIQNWNEMYSWGQDTVSVDASDRAVRGYISARFWNFSYASYSYPIVGFRPVLEVPKPDTLGSDGLKVVTLDLGGGKLGNSSEDIQIIVKNGSEFTAPASDGMTRPDGNTGSYFMWRGSNGKLYAPGASVPADVTKLTAQFALSEQFSLTPGGRYYFDLSAMDIPGTANSNLPDSTLHYVPFTYVGTVDAYSLKNEADKDTTPYEHSLFIANYNVTHTVSWNDLNTAGLLFGKDYAGGGVNYTLRAPSAGFHYSYDQNVGGTPRNNEWDVILDKAKQGNNDNTNGYVKNWQYIYSWGQDTTRYYLSRRAIRGCNSARSWNNGSATYSGPNVGFRPVLELPTDLAADSLKAVELRTGKFMPGEQQNWINIIVKNGESFTAPSAEGLPRPDGISEDAQLYWSDENGNCYKPGDTVPADVSMLSITGDYEVIYLPGTYGTGSAVTDMKPHNNILTLRGALFTRAGYTQVGWATVDGGEKVYGFEDIYTKNEALTLYPVWNTNKYTITFDTNGGSEIAPITQDYGTKITAPDNPTRKGFTFKGWDKEIPKTMPAENITVKAQWEINQYTITFDTNGGSEIAPITQDYGTEITAPDNPTRKGYTFKGWDKEIPKTMPAENITLKAQWEINQYTITFDTNGGSEIAPITQDYGTEITAPDKPTRKGYTFKGWDKEIPETMPAENITITARWKDTEKPTGEIIIGTNKWNEFLNELTFGIFFKDTQEVTINAVDNSGVVFVSYLVTDKELSEAELNSLVFRAYEEPFCIDPNGEYIIYVMLVDENINITYLRSDRITLDNIQPVISGIENGKTYCEAQTVTVDEKYVDTVTVNGTAVTLDADGGFVLPPTNGEQKIVVTDKAGNNAEMTVTVNNGHTFGEWVSDNDGKHTRKCTVDGCDAFETENCSGGNATCTEKAVCDVCGKAYGELDGTNHEGGVQEWTTRTAFNHEQKWNCCGAVIVASEAHEWKDGVCRECGYVCLHNDADKDHICDYCKKTISEHVDKDKNHICDYCKKTISAHEDAPTEEIKKADTVTAKLPDDSKSPQTGDNSNLILWIALLIISGGVMKGVTAFGKSKKHSAKIKDK